MALPPAITARKLFTAALLMLALLPLIAGCAVNPVTKKREFSLMNEAQEAAMGLKAYPIYTQQSGGLYLDEPLQLYVSGVGKKIAAKGHRPSLVFEFNVVNDGAINAYALPGGKITITRGLLTKMENEAQLAAVLGHEIGHVTARHGAAGYTRQVLTGLVTSVGMAALETADIKGKEIIAQGGMIGAKLVLTKYSRDQERQSDDLGIEYMVAAGYDPRGFTQAMELLEGAKRREPSLVEAMMSSHPITAERVTVARKRADAYPAHLKTDERLGREPFKEATTKLSAAAPAFEKMEQGQKLFKEGKTDEGLALIREAAKDAPGHATLQVALASGESEAKNLEAARDAALEAVRLDPGLFHARFAAGMAQFEVEDYRPSLAELTQADGIVPGQPRVLFFIGRNHEELGDTRAAAKAYVGVLQKVKKGPMAEHSYKQLVAWGYVKK